MWPKFSPKRLMQTVEAALPDGVRVYAIGDIHGCAQQLDAVTHLIADDIAAHACNENFIVLLGDYIDRGPHSAQVIDRFVKRAFPAPFVPLRGNHEEMLLRFLNEPDYLPAWRRFGGIETLHSFGVTVPKIISASDYESIRGDFQRVFPQEVLQLLLEMPTSVTIGNYFFCHAGIRPGVSLSEQQDADLLWIRDEFLNSRVNHGKRIVHGHTPVQEADVRANRINIDTGAYLTGKLTCIVLEGDEIRWLRS